MYCRDRKCSDDFLCEHVFVLSFLRRKLNPCVLGSAVTEVVRIKLGSSRLER